MTVKEIKQKLDGLGVEYPSDANKAELEELLESVQGESEEVEEEAEEVESEEPVEEEVEEQEVPSDKDAVAVVKGSVFIRIYSKDLHGKEFKKLAEGFADKEAGRSLMAPSKIKGFVVSYRDQDDNGRYMEGSKEFSFEEIKKARSFANEKKVAVLFKS